MKILILTPLLSEKKEIATFAETLGFLAKKCELEFLDPLFLNNNLANHSFYLAWHDYLSQCYSRYDAFIGFSFGGVIIQQCFSVFKSNSKPLLLFSTPTFANNTLANRLGQVISLCEEKKLEQALQCLYQYVYLNSPPINFSIMDEEQTLARLINGLTRVLKTDSREQVNNCRVNHLHLIGEHSELVNKDNVLAPKTGELIIVPNAGMRVLEDNRFFCEQKIIEALKC